jgi:hypothetical protein
MHVGWFGKVRHRWRLLGMRLRRSLLDGPLRRWRHAATAARMAKECGAQVCGRTISERVLAQRDQGRRGRL